MDPDMLCEYLTLLAWPAQLPPDPHPASLALLHARHLRTLPYQSRCQCTTPSSSTWLSGRDLHHHLHLPRPSLAVAALLSSMPVRGGHCYQHSELMYAALVALGYRVDRIASYVLQGETVRWVS